jgi:predicted small secreted protein
MRVALIVPILLLAGCNVSKEGNAVTVQYDQNTAENTAADVGNVAQNIAGDIGNDVKKTGDKLENKIGNADIDVKVGHDDHANTTTKTTTTTTENKSK